MAKHIRTFVGLTLLLAAVSASAQSQITQTIQVNVPFPFVAAGKAWPAAEYRVQIAQPAGLVTLTSPGVKPASILTNKDLVPLSSANKTFLKFQRYGDRWVLKEVAHDGTAQLLMKGKMERELAKADQPSQETLIAATGN